jgi:hypothetical protein
MAPPSARLLAPAVLAALSGCFGVFGCFNSDELFAANDTGTSASGDTVTMYSDESGSENDDNWTAGETGPGETTCRDAIECLVMCQSAAIFNMDPEPDLSCFLECDQGLTTEEAYLLIKLAECIGNTCAENGSCGPESTNNDCLICIAANGTDPQPPGCIDEAAACQ